MISVCDNPLEMFAAIFEQARQHPDIPEPSALCLATASPSGKASNRMVLLKDFSDKGFTFYTNLGSKKAQQLAANQWAAMCFYWHPLGKQVRIEGKVAIVSDDTADAYFASRAPQSRIGAWASRQSEPLNGQSELLKRLAICSTRWATESLKRPPFWSGFCLQAELIEFWTQGKFRLHERIEYKRDTGNRWQHRYLYP